MSSKTRPRSRRHQVTDDSWKRELDFYLRGNTPPKEEVRIPTPVAQTSRRRSRPTPAPVQTVPVNPVHIQGEAEVDGILFRFSVLGAEATTKGISLRLVALGEWIGRGGERVGLRFISVVLNVSHDYCPCAARLLELLRYQDERRYTKIRRSLAACMADAISAVCTQLREQITAAQAATTAAAN